MARRRIRVLTRQGELIRAGFARARAELGVAESFPPAVLAAARSVATRAPIRESVVSRIDATDIDFVTIDPVGSKDLDQALHIESSGAGYRVHYAIADVAFFVDPGSAIDVEAHARGVTLYCPDERIPLHPTVLSEGAASLLPEQHRPAVLWTMDLDARGELVSTHVQRAWVRSRSQWAYDQVQRHLDGASRLDDQPVDHSAAAVFALLKTVGALRVDREQERGGVDLPTPEQVVEEDGPGFRLVFRAPEPVEAWNAQMSLLTGMAAADLMLDHKVGILRTMPPPAAEELDRVRRTAAALGVDWPTEFSYAELMRGLDAHTPSHAAFLTLATVLLRGAGYTAFDARDGDDMPSVTTHSAVAAPYSHVTAPLRRLVDRYATEVCLALCAGTNIPKWALDALPKLPAEMAAADRRDGALERASVDLVEAVLLSHRVGQSFRAMVVEQRNSHSVVQLTDPAVRADAFGDLPLGQAVFVRLVEADPDRRVVRFEPAALP